MSKKCYTIIIGLILVMFAVTGCNQDVSSQMKEQLALGQKYLEEDDYEQAVVAFNKVIALDEKQIEAYIGLADVYMAQEEFEQAQAVLAEGLNKCEDSGLIQEKIKEVEELIQAQEAAAVSQAVDVKLQELGGSLGYIDASTYTTEKQGISSYVLCDVDADGVDELLVTYMSGVFSDMSSASSGVLDSCDLWASLYDYQDGQMILTAEQQIGRVDYCDAMTVRLIFSEQQAAFCIVTNEELIGAYTGVREFVSELYKISIDGIKLQRHWSQNSMENLNDSPDRIIAEMQRVGIPYIDMNYFSYGTEYASDAEEQILYQNTVGTQGTDVDAVEREYGLYFSTYEELNALNGTNEFGVGQEEYQLLKARTELGIEENDFKESVRDVLCVIENLYRDSNGVELDRSNRIEGPGYPAYDDFYAEAIGFHSMDEVKNYVHSMVSDSLYEEYFDEETYMEIDGKVYLRYSTVAGGKMDMDSLEIESVEDDIYKISIDEYLGQEYYLNTVLVTIQKTDDGWKALEAERNAIDKGYTRRFGGTEGDFI
ncbi:MAG TPA: tetratricopeptide repeat protein [Candidatus Merdisoma merdipullorum]|nr:tetratricopeptide repeat protein [Candidatus Merdisoma merdipullorum]